MFVAHQNLSNKFGVTGFICDARTLYYCACGSGCEVL